MVRALCASSALLLVVATAVIETTVLLEERGVEATLFKAFWCLSQITD